MIAKKYRLPVQSALGKRGRLVKGRYFSVLVLPTDKGYSQVGVVVGVAVDKRATVRNALKRMIYDSGLVYCMKPPHRAVVIRVFPAVKDASRHAILDELRNLLA